MRERETDLSLEGKGNQPELGGKGKKTSDWRERKKDMGLMVKGQRP